MKRWVGLNLTHQFKTLLAREGIKIMAFAVADEITNAKIKAGYKVNGLGLKLNNMPVDVLVATKLTGDTASGTISMTKMKLIQKVKVYDLTNHAFDLTATFTLVDDHSFVLNTTANWTSALVFVQGMRIG